MKWITRSAPLAACLLLVPIEVLAEPVNSSFTYQGYLTQNGTPLNGTVFMEFYLYDDEDVGEVSGYDVAPTLQITNGLFTVDLDFGSNVFRDYALWLQIVVDGWELQPRRLVTAAPYALQTRGMMVRDDMGDYKVGIGTSFPTRALEVAGDGVCTGVAGAGGSNFSVWQGDKAVTLRQDLNDTFLSNKANFPGNGTTSNGRLVLNGEGGIFLKYGGESSSGTDGLTLNTLGKVGIGTTAPDARLEVIHGEAVVMGEINGIYGEATNTSGSAFGTWTIGVHGRAHGSISGASTHIGIFGEASGGTGAYAGYFLGDVLATGRVHKSGGSFRIDHPLDPENKYLLHSFVESPDMMNVYNGNIVLDDSGEAVVELPEWFGALNRDFRYQLTCIGGFAPVYVAEKVKDNRFKIAGGTAGLEVSWQLTGIRKDPWAEANRIPVERDKPAHDRGRYLHPELFGKPSSQGVGPRPAPDPSHEVSRGSGASGVDAG